MIAIETTFRQEFQLGGCLIFDVVFEDCGLALW